MSKSKRVNATHYENIPPFPKSAKRGDCFVHVIVETTQGSAHKNALDNDLGIITMRAVLAEGLRWPYDYGFIPQTLADDGDPIDALYLIDRPTFPGCMAEARVLGSVKLKKNGVENDRIITAPKPVTGVKQSMDDYDDIDQLPPEKMDEIRTFLIRYSQDEGNELEYLGTRSASGAMKSVRKAMKDFQKKAG